VDITTRSGERRTTIRSVLVLAALALSTLIAGCGSRPADSDPQPTSAAVNRQEASAMAEDLLAGFNAGDYAAFSRDWSPALKDGITEPGFAAFRDELMGTNGAFESISNVTLTEADTPGHVKYVFATEFDKGPVTVTITLQRDRDQIEGIFMESAG
jgi:Protein of unknown function (DUF3887)